MKNFKEIREKYRSKFPPSLVAAAVKIALEMGGAMTPAVKKIEAMKRGLSNDPIVKDALRQALRQANESVKEGKKLKPADQEKLAGMFNSLMGVKHGSPQFKKIKAEIQSILGEDSILEGTWAVPDSYEKLVKLQKDVLNKPHRANTVKDVDNFISKVYNLFGDDSFFDMLDLVKDVIKGKKLNDYLSTKAVKFKLGKGMDLNLLLQRELNRWTNGQMTFKGNKIDTVPGSWMDKESQDEAMKRGRGNIKMKMDKKVKFEL